MANSGLNDTWLKGKWPVIFDPAEYRWVAWYWDGALQRTDSDTTPWEALPDTILTICVCARNFRAINRMSNVDEYPHPFGEGPSKQGAQIGEVDGASWQDIKAIMRGQEADL